MKLLRAWFMGMFLTAFVGFLAACMVLIFWGILDIVHYINEKYGDISGMISFGVLLFLAFSAAFAIAAYGEE